MPQTDDIFSDDEWRLLSGSAWAPPPPPVLVNPNPNITEDDMPTETTEEIEAPPQEAEANHIDVSSWPQEIITRWSALPTEHRMLYTIRRSWKLIILRDPNGPEDQFDVIILVPPTRRNLMLALWDEGGMRLDPWVLKRAVATGETQVWLAARGCPAFRDATFATVHLLASATNPRGNSAPLHGWEYPVNQGLALGYRPY